MSAGLAFMTGPRGQPMRAGASIVDVGAAAYGVIAVLAALHQRARTGRGPEDHRRASTRRRCSGSGSGWRSYAATGEPSVPMPEMRQGTRMGWGIYQLFTAADERAGLHRHHVQRALGAVLRRSSGSTTCSPTSG